MPFWEWFRQEVTKFEEAAKNLTTEELFMLVDEKGNVGMTLPFSIIVTF